MRRFETCFPADDGTAITIVVTADDSVEAFVEFLTPNANRLARLTLPTIRRMVANEEPLEFLILKRSNRWSMAVNTLADIEAFAEAEIRL